MSDIPGQTEALGPTARGGPQERDWIALVSAIRDLHAVSPDLRAFCRFPDALVPCMPEPRPIPASRIVAGSELAGTNASQPAIDAIRKTAPLAKWQRTYSEDEVGADFRNRYGYFQLIGPNGVFRTSEMQGYVAYWGDGLSYDWHHHEAEELYYVLAGEATFYAQGMDDFAATAGDVRMHASDQDHAMQTFDKPVLAYVAWRGPGVGKLPKMGRKT